VTTEKIVHSTSKYMAPNPNWMRCDMEFSVWHRTTCNLPGSHSTRSFYSRESDIHKWCLWLMTLWRSPS
jgi:hypothetical protein